MDLCKEDHTSHPMRVALSLLLANKEEFTILMHTTQQKQY